MLVSQTFIIAAPPDLVARALCSEAYNLDIQKDRAELVSAEYRVVQDSDDALVFELRCQEYDRKKTGGLNRNKLVPTLTRTTWHRGKQQMSWTYDGVGSQWVTLNGVYHLAAAGSATTVRHEVEIEVHIPIIGKQIAKLVAKELQHANQRIPEILFRHARLPHES